MVYPEFYELCHNSVPDLGSAALSSGVYSCSYNALPNAALTKGALYTVTFGTANEGACSLKINNAPAYSIRIGAVALRKGDITANKAAFIYFDGQYIQLVANIDMLSDSQMKSPLGVAPAKSPSPINALMPLNIAMENLEGQLRGGKDAIKSVQSGELTVSGNLTFSDKDKIPSTGYFDIGSYPAPVISGGAEKSFTISFSPLNNAIGMIIAEWHAIELSVLDMCAASNGGSYERGNLYYCYHELDGIEILPVNSSQSTTATVPITNFYTDYLYPTSSGLLWRGNTYFLAYKVKWKLLEFGQGA